MIRIPLLSMGILCLLMVPVLMPEVSGSGTELFVSGDYAGAVDAFGGDLAAAQGADRVPILNNIGTCYMALGEPEKAAGFYEQAVEADTGYGRGWINLGVVQEKLGRTTEALSSYGKVTGTDPAIFADAMVKKGTLLSARGNLEEARAAFEAGIPGATGRVSADIYTGIGAIAFMQKDPADAEAAFLKAIDADPEGAVMAWTNLGVLHITRGRYTDAKTAFETAIRHDPAGTSAAREYLANLKAMIAANVTPKAAS